MATHPSAGAGGEFRVEVMAGRSMVDLGRYMKGLDKAMATAVRSRMRKGISTAGRSMVDAVKAESAWSTRIPATVRLKTSFAARSAGVTITAGGKAAPEAMPLEYGSGRSGTNLRHPVFARKSESRDQWTWVNQPTRPFFFAAVRGKTPQVQRDMAKVLDDVAKDIGFTD